MAFDWKAFLALARDLQTQARGAANPESLLRTALSRAYYAAFCHSRNYAQAWLQFAARDDADDHGRLRAHLKTKKRRGVSERLDRLRQWRNESDYHDAVSFDLLITLANALQQADYIFGALASPKRP